MVKIKCLAAVLLVLLLPRLYAQSVRDTENVSIRFNRAIQLFDSSKYEEAQKIFNNIVTRSVYNSCTTISYIFEGKSLLNLSRYEDAKNVLNSFIEKYPASNYTGEARLTLAEVYIQQKDYLQAFCRFIAIPDSSPGPFYSNYSKTNAEKLALNYLTAVQLKAISDSINGDKAKPFVLLVLGKLLMQNGNAKEAEDSFSEILKKYPDSEEKGEAAILYNHLESERQLTGSPVIAALLPVSTSKENDDAGTTSDITEGIKFAFSEYNNQSAKKVGLVIKNSGRKAEQIKKTKDELLKLPTLKAIIGPVYSDEVKEALEIFKGSGIPIISPTATDDSLTTVYPDFFQANPSFLIRGKILAEYIYYVENKREMAVLNSLDNYTTTLADSFIREFEELGGKIVIHKTYNSDSLSFNSQIEEIALNSSKIDGLFTPLFNKNIVSYMLSQFLKYNLNLPLYGNQDWLSAKGYETYPALSNKLTFSSDYFLDYSDTVFLAFCNRFSAQTGKEVNRSVLYGYDAARYILTQIKDFSVSPTVLKKELESGTVFNGFHNQISFDAGRINKYLNIVRYKDGKFQLIDKFKYNK